MAELVELPPGVGMVEVWVKFGTGERKMLSFASFSADPLSRAWSAEGVASAVVEATEEARQWLFVEGAHALIAVGTGREGEAELPAPPAEHRHSGRIHVPEATD